MALDEVEIRNSLIRAAYLVKKFDFINLIKVAELEDSDMRVLRRIFADLVKSNVFIRIPDYEKGKIIFYINKK